MHNNTVWGEYYADVLFFHMNFIRSFLSYFITNSREAIEEINKLWIRMFECEI